MKPAILGALLVVLAAAVTNCVTTLERHEDADGMGGEAYLHRWNAFMSWNCAYPDPVVFLKDDALVDASTLRATLAHERAHVQRAMSMGCRRWHEWRADASHRIIIEAEAYCASVLSRVKDGGDSTYWFNHYARALRAYDLWINHMTLDQARGILGLYCG